MARDYKYKMRFTSKASCLIKKEKDKNIILASYKDLAGLLPKEFEGAQDLLAIVGNVATINIINKNGDLMTSSVAKKLYKGFKGRPINLDHSGADIIGHFTNASLTSYDPDYQIGAGSEPLENEPEDNSSTPFNITLGGVIYKSYFSELSNNIEECSDPESVNFGDLSFSWEVAFNRAALVLSKTKEVNLAECEIIEDELAQRDFVGYLKRYGGDGIYKDKRLIAAMPIFEKNADGTDDLESILFTGAGIVYLPAGTVKGILTKKTQEVLDITDKSSNSVASIIKSFEVLDNSNKDKVVAFANSLTANANNTPKIVENIVENAVIENKVKINDNIISQIEKPNVIEIINMKKFKNLAELAFVEQDNLKDYCKASLQEAVETAIRDADKQSKELLTKEQTAHAESQTKIKANEDQINKLSADLETIKAELEKVKVEKDQLAKAQADAQSRETFNTRMAFLDTDYNLDDEDRKVIASDIQDLDDAGFEKYKAKFAVLAKAKKKDATKAEVTDVNKIVASAKATTETVVLNSTTVTENPDDKYKNAFSLGEGVTLK